MATYVGKWDCPSCGTKRIPGWKDGRTVERCPACNAPSTKKWYLDSRDMVISDPEEIAKAKSKRAWTCGHCGAVNDGGDSSCDACGNPRDSQSDDKVSQDRLYKPGDVPTSGEEVEGAKEAKIGSEFDRPTIDGQEDHTWRCPRCNLWNQPYSKRCLGCNLPKAVHKTWKYGDKAVRTRPKIFKARRGLIFLSIFGIIALILSGFIPKTVEVTVTGFAWERQVSIHDYAQRSRSDWYSAPPGAYNVTSQEEVHHYDKVFSHRECNTESYVCGTRDNGNGTFSDEYCTREACHDVYDEIPVYATKYYYNIMDWEHHHYENSSGEDHKPIWPKDPRTQSHPNSWREGSRSGTYFTYVSEKGGRIKKREMEQKRWKSTEVGDKETGKKAWLYGVWYGFD